MKKICIFIITLFLISSLYTQSKDTLNPEEYSWRMLQKAQTAFDQKDFGLAFKLADAAKINRKREVDWSISTLEQAMKPVAVQKVGDNIDAVLTILQERDSHDAVTIIESNLSNLSKEYFDHSISNLKNHIRKYSEYPEADFLIGKIYELEGEYSLSKMFLLKAWENADLLSIPDEKYDFLYEMASLAELTGDKEEYEKSLLLIIAEDPNYLQNTSETGFSKSIVKAIKTGTDLDKFFLLYRNTSYFSMKAFFSLADFYTNEQSQSLVTLNDKILTMSSMGVVTAISRIEDVIKTRKLEYTYTSFETLLSDVLLYEDIVTWGKKYDVWKGFYVFALAVFESGQTKFAENLLAILSKYSPDEYWAKASKERIFIIENSKKVLVR